MRAENDLTRATFNEKFKMQTSEPSFSFPSYRILPRGFLPSRVLELDKIYYTSLQGGHYEFWKGNRERLIHRLTGFDIKNWRQYGQ